MKKNLGTLYDFHLQCSAQKGKPNLFTCCAPNKVSWDNYDSSVQSATLHKIWCWLHKHTDFIWDQDSCVLTSWDIENSPVAHPSTAIEFMQKHTISM